MVSIFMLVFIFFLSYYYTTTKLIFILFFSINRFWNQSNSSSYKQSETRCLSFVHGHNKKAVETIEIHVGTAIL